MCDLDNSKQAIIVEQDTEREEMIDLIRFMLSTRFYHGIEANPLFECLIHDFFAILCQYLSYHIDHKGTLD